MKPRSMIKSSYWCGFISYGLISMFIQDLMGKQNYLEAIEKHWIDIHWIVWIPPFIITLWWYHKLLNNVPK